MQHRLRGNVFAVTLAIGCMLPLLASAQSTDLQTSVRAALASDPRTNSMSEAQIDAMVAALSQGAAQQGMTAQDISWKPIPTQGGAALATQGNCGGFPSYLCSMSEAFGFTGPDSIFAIWLGVSALLLMFIIGTLLEYRHFRHLHPKHTASQP